MTNFSSVALFVQKLLRWVILPHPNCLTYIKKPNWERVKQEVKGKVVTDQGHITEKLMKKIQHLYGIALEQNVDYQRVDQLKIALAVGTVYFTKAPSFIVKTENCY